MSRSDEHRTAAGRAVGRTSTGLTRRAPRARVRARRGALDEARSLVEAAIDIAAPTDFVTLQALAFSALAEVERSNGRPDRAIVALRQALDRYERKEDLPDAERTRARIQALQLEPKASR